MKTQTGKTEKLDEIVFANRNQEYGAYAIRRDYPRYVNRASGISALMLLISVAVPLIAGYYDQNRLLNREISVNAEISDLTRPPEEAAPHPPPPPPATLEKKFRFTAPIISDIDTMEGNDALDQEKLKSLVVNTMLSDTGMTSHVVEKPPVLDNDKKAPEVFTFVEEFPEFPGGEESRLIFLKENLRYPQMAREIGIQGTVYLSFIIDDKGRVADVSLIRGIGGGCDEEAVRVVKMMPRWIPGKQGGQAVHVRFSMPVKFTLN